MNAKTIGKQVRAQRERRRLCAAEVARAARVHPSTIARIEQGEIHATVSTLAAIAKVLRVPVTRFLDE